MHELALLRLFDEFSCTWILLPIQYLFTLEIELHLFIEIWILWWVSKTNLIFKEHIDRFVQGLGVYTAEEFKPDL